MSNLSRCAISSLAASLVIAAACGSPVQALEIAQTPLFIGAKTQPNFILALDDSTSMFLETVFPGGNPDTLTWDAESKSFFAAGTPPAFLPPGEMMGYFGVLSYIVFAGGLAPMTDYYAFARNPGFNAIYFNPSTSYLPWRKADGSRWPLAVPTKTKLDPREGAAFAPENSKVIDLTSAIEDQDAVMLFPGMLLPEGTPYLSAEFYLFNEDNDPDDQSDDFLKMSGCGPSIPSTGGQWSTMPSGAVVEYEDTDGNGEVNALCSLKLQAFLPTFYLASPTLLPLDYGYVGAPYEVTDAYGPGSESLWRYEIRPENFADGAAYTSAITNFANWFQYYRTRLLSVVASTTEALNDILDVRVATFKINDPVSVVMRALDVPLSREAIYDQLTSLQATAKVKNDFAFASTPNRSAVAHMGKQFQRVDADAPIVNACQTNVGMLFTDGYTSQGDGPYVGNADASLDAPFQDGQSDTMADIVTSYYEGENTPLREGIGFEPGQLPVPASCKDDPDPRVDCQTNLHMKFHAVTLGPRGAIHGIDPAATADPYANPPDWDAFGSPKLSAGPVVIDELWHATLNGRGSFVSAETPSEVTDAIKAALKSSIIGASFTGGIAASGTRRDHGFLAYVPRYNAEDWTGDLTAHDTSENGKFDERLWSAAERLASIDLADRRVFFSSDGKALLDFTVEALGGEAEAVQRLGLPSVAPFGRSVEEVVAYLRGDHSFEQKHPGGTLRNRSSRIGDIFGSQPEVLTSAGYGYSGLPKEQGGGVTGAGSYGEFLQTVKANRTPVAFVGANDGMLHAFDASTGPGGGRELFAIIPGSVLENVGGLPDPAYEHRYFVDGSPVQGDAYDGAWKTILLVPMGAGGRSIMALDVTNPVASFDQKNFLWEFTDPDLHETLGRPHIVLLESGKWAAVFGSGLDPAGGQSSRAHVFFVDLFSGKLIAKVEAQDTTGFDPFAVDGFVNVAPVDTDYNLKADALYAVDYDASLWKIDIGGDNSFTLAGGGKPLFTARGRDESRLMVTGGVDVFPHHIRGHMVFFGTGRFLEAGDKVQLFQTQSMFGVWDDPLNNTKIMRADLQEQEIYAVESVDGITARRITDSPVNWQTQRGWALDLKVKNQPFSGEIFIGHPSVALGRLNFMTYTSLFEGGCGAAGINRFYSIAATTGIGELLLPGATGTFGSIEIPASSSGSGPIMAPSVVASPPPPPCLPGSPNCPAPTPDEQGNVLTAPSAGCKTNLGLLLGDGLMTFDRLTCGRQSWQQLK